MNRAKIRAAHPGDAQAIADVHVQTWQESYAELLSPATIQRHARRALQVWSERLIDPGSAAFWVAEGSSGVVGFAWTSAAGAGEVRSLELVGMYLLASHHGSGTADDLLLCATGEAPCYLWVAQDNPRAQAFYRRHGFHADGEDRVVEQWDNITVMRMVR